MWECSKIDFFVLQHQYSDSYRYGFKVGCVLVEGNTDDSCELTIKGHATYCPFNPDDPACTEFLHDASNKQPHSTLRMGQHLIILAVLKF